MIYKFKKSAAVVNALLILSIAAQPAYAASVILSNSPMAAQNTAKSNIIFTMDTSGGMDVEVLLPTFNSMYYESTVTPGNNPTNLNGNFFLFPTWYRSNNIVKFNQKNKPKTTQPPLDMNLMLEGDVNSPDPLNWRVRNNHYNHQYYDPFTTYQPWNGLDINGVTFTNATPTQVEYDPYSDSLGKIDLTQEISSGPNRTDAAGNKWTVPQAHTYTSGGKTGSSYDSIWYPATYYTWADKNNNGVMDAGEETRYEIKDPATSLCKQTKVAANTIIPGCAALATYPSGRTYQAEMQNFANWFKYYRTVMLTLQGSIGKQLDTLGNTQVGMTSLESPAIAAPVTDISNAAALEMLRGQIYALAPNLGDWRQPIHDRMSQVYDYFKQKKMLNGVPAPIKYSCQQNFNVLVTAGYLNENGTNAKGFKNNFTNTNPSLNGAVGDYDSTTNANPASGAGTKPYADGLSKVADTLADWALYIYDQNLRPDLPAGNVQLIPATHETNPNPHLDTYVIAPGATPSLSNAPSVINSATTDPYTVLPSINWPIPAFLDQTTIDDLWHAAVNGRGKFVGGMDIYGGLQAVLNDIMGRIGSAAAVAVSNANISPGDSFSYASSYNTGNWSGDLQSFPIDLLTGIPSAIGKWLPSSRDQLDALVMLTGRKIATHDGTKAVPFQLANLTTPEKDSLNTPGTTDNATVLAFLRGDRSNEGTLYRNRGHVLGDIIDAEPVVVREPLLNYADNGYGAYKAQYTVTTPRLKTVFQAANDGMLHAFDANLGSELWAYIPGLILNQRDAVTGSSKLVNLSSKAYAHEYFVNGTPASGDIDFGNTSAGLTTPNWHSILVGGLRKGGRGYYALDVTDPNAATEAAVAAKVMWEFPNANTPASTKANMGYSYATPLITKTAANGWVVIIPSGINNGTNPGDSGGDGLGHLFVLDAKTGALLKDISTGVGSTTTPSNLSEISGWVDNVAVDNTVTQVYGTDMSGNVWRFDISDKSMANWKTTLLATLVDSAGLPQPITTTPELALINGKRTVYVGTGQYLSGLDIPSVPAVVGQPNTQVQTMYSLIDDMSLPAAGTPVIFPLRAKLTQQLIVAGGTTRTINAVPLLQTKGWYVDLSVAGTLGERIITAPAIANTTLIFTTNVPNSSDPCSPGGSSWLYSLNYATGGMVASSTWAAQSLGNTLASRPILVQLPDGTVKALVRQSNASTIATSIPVTNTTPIGKRVAWREIIKS